MDNLTFIAKLVEYVAWPVASIILVVFLKDEVAKLVPALKRIKAGPLEAEFDREIEQLKTETPGLKGMATVDDAKSVFVDESLLQLAEVHPRSAVLEAWVRLEAAARNALPHDSSKAAGSGYIPAAKLAEALVTAGKINQSQVTLYHELRRLRNDVAHLVGLAPTKESVLSYVELAAQLHAQLSLSHAGK